MGTLAGRQLLVTSGSTRGLIDRVRYITNRSTGKLGAILSEGALARGASVTYLYGRGSFVPDPGPAADRLAVKEVETVEEVMETVEQIMSRSVPDAVIHSMAVLDYVPADFSDQKIKSGKDEWHIRLVPTPKIIAVIRDLAPEAFLVSFKLEVGKSEEELIEIARAHLSSSSSDLVLANDLARIEAGRHLGILVDAGGAVVARVEGKAAIAETILDAVEGVVAGKEAV
ncbi:MAG: phosphopantothenoylcysteine decarboxylase [Anaerolineae bacterium]